MNRDFPAKYIKLYKWHTDSGIKFVNSVTKCIKTALPDIGSDEASQHIYHQITL